MYWVLGTGKLISNSGFFIPSAPVSWAPGPWASCLLSFDAMHDKFTHKNIAAVFLLNGFEKFL
jgi:hypothetical protein